MPELHQKMKAYQLDMEKQVKDKADVLRAVGVEAYLQKAEKK